MYAILTSVMQFHIHAKNAELSDVLKDFIEEKIGELQRFLHVPADEIQAWVEVGKITNHHEHGNIFEAKIDLGIPGQTFRVQITGEDINSAVLEARDELQREIRRFKEKHTAQQRKGMRTWKKFRTVVGFQEQDNTEK